MNNANHKAMILESVKTNRNSIQFLGDSTSRNSILERIVGASRSQRKKNHHLIFSTLTNLQPMRIIILIIRQILIFTIVMKCQKKVMGTV